MDRVSAEKHPPTRRISLLRLFPPILTGHLLTAFLVLASTGQLTAWQPITIALILSIGSSLTLTVIVSRQLDSQIAMLRDETAAVGIAREQLTAQIREAATLEERNRLARELHDSIKQQIFTINVGVAAAQARQEHDPEGAKRALADVRASTKEAMVEMNAMLQQLSPRPLENVGLIQAIRQQGEALAYRTGAEVETDFDVLPADSAFPIGSQEMLFRITQEALANIARHARAGKVKIKLARKRLGKGDGLLLEIADDGQGFDQMRVERGMGLSNIRQRAEQMNGRFELLTAPDRGTTVRVTMPLDSTEPQAETESLPNLPAPARRAATVGMSLIDQPYQDNLGFLSAGLFALWPDSLLMIVQAFVIQVATAQLWLAGLGILLVVAAWEVVRMRRISAELTPTDLSEQSLHQYRHLHHLQRQLLTNLGLYVAHLVFLLPAEFATPIVIALALITIALFAILLQRTWHIRTTYLNQSTEAVRVDTMREALNGRVTIVAVIILLITTFVIFADTIRVPAETGVQWLLLVTIVWTVVRLVERSAEILHAWLMRRRDLHLYLQNR